jgi:hypothetical protein
MHIIHAGIDDRFLSPPSSANMTAYGGDRVGVLEETPHPDPIEDVVRA